MTRGEEALSDRAARPEEIVQILALKEEQVLRYERLAAIPVERVLAQLRQDLEREIGRYRVLCRSGETAGFFRIGGDARGLWLHDLYLLEPFRGKGIGRMVVARCIARAREERKTLSLYVFAGNLPARALYERCGFRTVETLRGNCLRMVWSEKETEAARRGGQPL